MDDLDFLFEDFPPRGIKNKRCQDCQGYKYYVEEKKHVCITKSLELHEFSPCKYYVEKNGVRI